MRVADKMNYDQVKSNLSKNRTEMMDLQNQAATQKRINKPSDDPMSATRVLTARTEISGSKQFIKNINAAKGFLEFSEQSLGDASEVLMRAKEIAINQANDPSAGPTSRGVSAAEVRQILSQLVQIGNRKYGDRYIFGGFRTTQAPFDVNGKYWGDDGEMKIPVDKSTKVGMNLPGSQIFIGRIKDGSQGGGTFDNEIDGTESRPNLPPDAVDVRGPASTEMNEQTNLSESWQTSGVNVFHVLDDLRVALETNDKASIQDSLDRIDESIAQIVLARAQLGWRANTLSSTLDQQQKGTIQSKAYASSLEDADTFELVSDINRTETTLKASLETSGKLIQPSLLDFLK